MNKLHYTVILYYIIYFHGGSMPYLTVIESKYSYKYRCRLVIRPDTQYYWYDTDSSRPRPKYSATQAENEREIRETYTNFTSLLPYQWIMNNYDTTSTRLLYLSSLLLLVLLVVLVLVVVLQSTAALHTIHTMIHTCASWLRFVIHLKINLHWFALIFIVNPFIYNNAKTCNCQSNILPPGTTTVQSTPTVTQVLNWSSE